MLSCDQHDHAGVTPASLFSPTVPAKMSAPGLDDGAGAT
jgi:hypothetical protein